MLLREMIAAIEDTSDSPEARNAIRRMIYLIEDSKFNPMTKHRIPSQTMKRIKNALTAVLQSGHVTAAHVELVDCFGNRPLYRLVNDCRIGDVSYEEYETTRIAERRAKDAAEFERRRGQKGE